MKKQWISVKCGLSRDPKHRQAMGESIWLFLHMIDRADWESGKVLEWKDEAEAEDMGMPVRTLREHRRKLEELDYISCAQKQYGQEITIHNWTNPREYSGVVTNKKQGGKEPSPSSVVQGDTQGYIQGYIQGSRKDVTPTSNSKNQRIKKNNADKPLTPPEILLYRQVTKKYPKSAVYGEVVSAIQKVSARLCRPCEASDLEPYFKQWLTKSANEYNFSVWLLEWAVNGNSAQTFQPKQKQNNALENYISRLEAAQ